jgi:hypothetical protein
VLVYYVHKHSLVTGRGQAFELCANNLKHLNASFSSHLSGRRPAPTSESTCGRLSIKRRDAQRPLLRRYPSAAEKGWSALAILSLSRFILNRNGLRAEGGMTL